MHFIDLKTYTAYLLNAINNISATVDDGGSGEEAVSDQNIDFEDVDSFENMFEIANMSQMLNLGNEL